MANKHLPISFYDTCFALIPKTRQENYRPVSLVKIDAKIVNQNLANQIQQYIKRKVHHDLEGLISGM